VIIKQCDPESWSYYTSQLPDFTAKFYYYRAYFKILADNGEGKPVALAFVNENNKILAFYPFLLKPVPPRYGLKGFFDLETPYGYGGPFFNCKQNNFVKEFQRLHHEWCLANKVVAEFIRFNPFTQNHFYFGNKAMISENRTTVSINTEKSLQEILKNCSPTCRRNFRKACKSGLQYDNCTLTEFVSVYHQTMKKLKADKYYFFGKQYFDNLNLLAEDKILLRAARTRSGKVAAAAIFLKDSTSMHFHLGGSDKNFLLMRPNEFLMLKAAQEANNNGLRLLHLGGGRTNNKNDSLYRFKKGFSKNRHKFYIGKIIHQTEIYNKLSKQWQNMTGNKPSTLLHYHYGDMNENL
jgi:lipid II:glycine glycyltransferase (peptidoglycan interpeptide bridge formation enzyme)